MSSPTEPTADEFTSMLEFERLRARARKQAQDELRQVSLPTRTPLRALTITELFSQPATTYLVDQLLPMGALAELVGDSETFKSFFAIHLGLSIAAGCADVFGQRVVHRGPVISIAAEGGGAFPKRVRAWAQASGLDVSAVPFFTVLATVNLRDESFQQELLSLIEQHGPVLIIVDTLHRAMPGAEENSAKDLGEVIAFASDLNRLHQTAVLFLHHPPKNAITGRGRGSSALYYAADTELSAAITSELQDGRKVVEFAVKKQKDDAKVSFTLVNRIVPIRREDGRPLAHETGRAVTSCVLEVAGDKDRQQVTRASELERRILDDIAANPNTSGNLVHGRLGGAKNAVNDAINNLKRRGRLPARGKWFIVGSDDIEM